MKEYEGEQRKGIIRERGVCVCVNWRKGVLNENCGSTVKGSEV